MPAHKHLLSLIISLAVLAAASLAASADASAAQDPPSALGGPPPATSSSGFAAPVPPSDDPDAPDGFEAPDRPGAAPTGESAAGSAERRSGGICPTTNPCWIDGVGEYQYFENCIQGGYGYVYSYIGYWGKDDFSYPMTGDRYWGHIVAGVVGSACGGEYIGTDIAFPEGTGFDLDGTPEGKIRCFYTSGRTGNTEEITDNQNADCRQNPGPGVYGGWGLGGRIIPAYGTIEIIFPLESAQALGTGKKMLAAIDTAISYPKVEFPEAYLAVPQKPSGGGGGGGGGNPGGPGGGGGGSTPKPSTVSAEIQRKSGSLIVTGLAGPARPAGSVTATLSRRKSSGAPFKKLGSKTVELDTESTYAAKFKRPQGGTCRFKVKLAADPAHEAASTTVTRRC